MKINHLLHSFKCTSKAYSHIIYVHCILYVHVIINMVHCFVSQLPLLLIEFKHLFNAIRLYKFSFNVLSGVQSYEYKILKILVLSVLMHIPKSLRTWA